MTITSRYSSSEFGDQEGRAAEDRRREDRADAAGRQEAAAASRL